MKKNWLCFVMLALMTSCRGVSSPTITPTPETVSPTRIVATETVTPTASPIPTDIPAAITPTLPATVEPFPTTPPETDYRPFSPVIARMAPGLFYLLGGTENGEWLSSETVIPHLSNETYQVFGMDGPTGSAKGKKPVRDQICQTYWVETDSYPLSGRAVGVTGDWDVTPRLAQEIPTDNPTYIDELKTWLIGKGFPEPVVEVSQILRVDIEGDGTNEVLISASHFVEPTGHSVELGDYSLVVMRKVMGNSVVTIPIIADYYYQDVELQFPLTYAGLLVADLNNDGILEVVVGVKRWEGSGVIAFEIAETNARPVFEAFCGL